MARNLLTEFIGTFFLVLTIGLTVVSGTPYAPIAIGSILMVMVYMGGHVSGAHYNPAVSLAVFLRGKLSAAALIPYWLAQFIAAFTASAVVYAITKKSLVVAPGPGVSNGIALLCEFLFTFALALVILTAATATATAGNSFYGLAIGFTVLASAYAVGGISGGAFNPAVGAGPILWAAITDHASMSNLWLYFVGPLAGGALAAGVYRILHDDSTTIKTEAPPELPEAPKGV